MEDESCYAILQGGILSLAKFLLINPDVDAGCTNLWLGYSYCIMPMTRLNVTATTTFTRPVSTPPPTSAFNYTPPQCLHSHTLLEQRPAATTTTTGATSPR